MGEQSRLHGYHVLEDKLNVGHETIRKFVEEKTTKPHPATREVYGKWYLELHPTGYVAERRTGQEGRRDLKRLKHVLPSGQQSAAETLDQIFAAEHQPDETRPVAEKLHAWLKKLLEAEYAAEARYPPRRKRPPKE